VTTRASPDASEADRWRSRSRRTARARTRASTPVENPATRSSSTRTGDELKFEVESGAAHISDAEAEPAAEEMEEQPAGAPA
jgi:hypothetical protein